MIIEVVQGEIGEDDPIELTSEDPVEVEGVGRDFHDNTGNAFTDHLR